MAFNYWFGRLFVVWIFAIGVYTVLRPERIRDRQLRFINSSWFLSYVRAGGIFAILFALIAAWVSFVR